MARYERFTIVCDKSERKAIQQLADTLQRSQSDAVRYVVLNAVKELAAKSLLITQTSAEGVKHGSG